jgi:hypothetical protein
MKSAFSSEQLQLLRETAQRRNPQLIAIIDAMCTRTLTGIETDCLHELLAEELASIGFDARTFEPTAMGLRLEALMDSLASPRQ